MSDYIEVPDSLMREVLEALLHWYPKGSESLADVPVALIDSVIEMFKDAGGCDHSVGICACGEEAIAAELLLLKDGKATCRECGGDGYVWSQDKYEAAAAKAKAEDDPYGVSDFAGNVECTDCEGRGIVRLDKERAKALAALPPYPGQE